MEQGLLGEESRPGHRQGGTRSLRQVGAMGGQTWKKGTAGYARVVTCVVRRKEATACGPEGKMCQAERRASAGALKHGNQVFKESPCWWGRGSAGGKIRMEGAGLCGRGVG